MSVETSNAPRELWAVVNSAGDQVYEGPVPEDKALAQDRADEYERFADSLAVAVPYVRRDLVVPTVDEIAQRLAERRGLGRPLGSDLADAKDMHEWLLSRIEGDNDER
jgi:hypothetical protein